MCFRTSNVVLQLHGLLYKYMGEEGGRWKSTDNEIVEKDADGNVTRVRFKAVSAVATPQSIQDLVDNHDQALADGRGSICIPGVRRARWQHRSWEWLEIETGSRSDRTQSRAI
jgi:hypothetical protein